MDNIFTKLGGSFKPCFKWSSSKIQDTKLVIPDGILEVLNLVLNGHPLKLRLAAKKTRDAILKF